MSSELPAPEGRLVALPDTQIFIVERGQGYPLIILHGGPGLDHHMFGDYLDPLGDQFRLILVDQRAQGRSPHCDPATWTLEQMARDVVDLAAALELDRYAVLGHSFGALVTLQNAVDYPGAAAQSIISSGFPASRFLEHVDANLEAFQPEELRQQVTDSWARELHVQTPEEVADLLHDQLPFQFGDPLDPRMAEYEARSAGAAYSADVLRYFASADYGGIEVEDRLQEVTQPALVLAGRLDRTCSVPAAEAMYLGIPSAELVIFENSGHMTFVEQNELYRETVRRFLNKYIN